MKFISVIFASLLVFQTCAAIPVIFEADDLTLDQCVDAVHCIAELLVEHEFDIDTDQLVIVEIITIITEVVRDYLGCQAILSDPPTRWEEIQHSTCMTIWRASTAITVIRLQRLVTEASDSVRTTWSTVQDTCARGQPILPCVGHLIETPDSTEIVPY